MQINLGKKPTPQGPGDSNKRGRVVVSMNPVRQPTYIDIDGNEYDSLNPRTRKLIKKAT